MKDLKKDFPILAQTIHGKALVYLDNSATTQKPKQVIKAITNYYEKDNANVHRGVHELSMRASIAYENAHETLAECIHADADEIIFTKGTTEGLNFLAEVLTENLQERDEILLTEMEHHSNFVPWQQIAKKRKLMIKIIPVKNYRLDLTKAKTLFTKKTKILSLTHMSNVLGTINPIKELGEIAHKNNTLVVVDAAQSVPHMPVNVKDLDCDFLVFSGHKMLGPTGIGVLYGKRKLLEKIKPYQYGGGMVQEVTLENASWQETPWKFEAGTPNIAGAIGLAAAANYLTEIGMRNIEAHTRELTTYALEQLKQIHGLTIIGPEDTKDRGPVISFTLHGIHPHDIGEILNQEGIAIRGGKHCAIPLMHALNIDGTNRISFHLYNTKKDIDILIKAIKKTKEIFQ
ncbi:SufS family cysteine desulfurase [Candidatus Woesearchaeota archaeon]|nr:SufS family cysteine desulfurase [Candidatus Woesearchaeota archaeon]